MGIKSKHVCSYVVLSLVLACFAFGCNQPQTNNPQRQNQPANSNQKGCGCNKGCNR